MYFSLCRGVQRAEALAAAAAATMLGASTQAVIQGLAEFRPSPMRLEIHTTDFGVTLINDTYNSDPASIKGRAGRARQGGNRSPQDSHTQ